MKVDGWFWDDYFDAGPVTEGQIDTAGTVIMKLVQSDRNEAEKADILLMKLLLHAIASGFVADPKRCAEHYFIIRRAAFGEPTLLDRVKARCEIDAEKEF